MSGAKQRERRRENALREKLLLEIKEQAAAQVSDIQQLPSRAEFRMAAEIGLEVENAIRCLAESKKRGTLGMHALAAELEVRLMFGLAVSPNGVLVKAVAARGVRDVKDLAAQFTASIIDPRMRVKTAGTAS